MKYNHVLTILLMTWFYALHGQDADTKNDSGHHDHRKNEIGIANAPVYSLTEKELSYGLHVHYLYNLPDTKFGIGAGYERIFDEHGHNTFGIVCAYRPVEHLNINVSPGLTVEDIETESANFSFHLEALYEYEINALHLGPVLEFAFAKEDYHISLGLHIGIGF